MLQVSKRSKSEKQRYKKCFERIIYFKYFTETITCNYNTIIYVEVIYNSPNEISIRITDVSIFNCTKDLAGFSQVIKEHKIAL